MMSSAADSLATTQLTSGASVKKPTDPDKLDKVAKDFEAMFLSLMLEHMFDGVSFGAGAMGSEESGGGDDEIYKSWMVEQYGSTIANHGGIGIADYIKREFLQLQEVP